MLFSHFDIDQDVSDEFALFFLSIKSISEIQNQTFQYKDMTHDIDLCFLNNVAKQKNNRKYDYNQERKEDHTLQSA